MFFQNHTKKNSGIKSILAVSCLLSLISGAAQAGTNRFSLIQNMPVLDEVGLVYTSGSQIPKKKFSFSSTAEYLYKPFELTAGGKVVRGITDHLLVNHLGFSWAPNAAWQLEAVLPVVAYNKFSSPFPVTPSFSNQWGVGDLFLRGKIRVRDKGKMGMALIPYVSLPTGNENHYIADKYPRGGLKLATDWRVSKRWYAATNLGVEAHQPVSLFDYSEKGRILMSAGVAYSASDRLKFKSDFVGATSLNRPFREKSTSPLEAMGKVEYSLKKHPVSLYAGGGVALVRGAATPLFRTMAGITVAFGKTPEEPRCHKKLPLDSKETHLQSSIYFKRGSAQLGAEQKVVLSHTAEILKKHPHLRLTATQEYAECSKAHPFNRTQTLRRAKAVKDYIMSLGISPDRIQIQGNPQILSCPAARHNANRRVEIQISGL